MPLWANEAHTSDPFRRIAHSKYALLLKVDSTFIQLLGSSMRLLPRLLAQLIHFRSHVVARLSCANLPALQLEAGEELVVLSSDNLDQQEPVCQQLLDLGPGNRAYLEEIGRNNIIGVVIRVNESIVHYGFVMKHNRTRSLLGLPKNAALSGHAFTLPSYRGRGAQGRSVLARAHIARDAGFAWIYAETSPGNLASQRGLSKGGMEILGRLDYVRILRFIVIRWRRPPGFNLVSWCL